MDRQIPAQDRNRASYNAVAARWHAARQGLDPREPPYLERFLAGLPAGSRILDLGCGDGRLALELVTHGHLVTGVDHSAGLLAIARRRLPAAEWVEAAIETFVPPPGLHGIVCWDALFHLERRHHAPLLERWAAALPPDGRLMLTSGGSAHPPFADTMFDQVFHYDAHPPEVLLGLLAQAGFEPLLAELMDQPDGGRDKGRLAVVARRR